MRRRFGFGLGMSILISASLIAASAVLESLLDWIDEINREEEEKKRKEQEEDKKK